MSVEALQKQLDALQRSHDQLLKTITLSNSTFGPSSDVGNIRQREDRNSESANAVFADTSTLSDDSDDEDESCFVQAELPPQSFDHEHLREHLKKYDWDEYGREILSTVVTDRGRLHKPHLFPVHPGPAEDRSHYSHFQVYDVGPDGVPELVEASGKENAMSKATETWHCIRDIGANNTQSQKVVGRITIAREPAPILFGALHLTMHNTFDMDEIFKYLVGTESSSANMHRAFSADIRRQKTFFFNFEYYTIIGDDCQPAQWQRSDADKTSSESHIPLSRCSAVVALALYDPAPKRIKNKSRRARTKYGWVQDIWSPWQVLNIQCNPDWISTTDTFESGHRYLNGPEAFLHALLTEYKDAIKRYEKIYDRITKLVTPNLDFLFSSDLRDKRLFEGKDFAWTRRYFWAHQALGNVNDSIRVMVDMFEDTFTEDVWEGKSNTLWPLLEGESNRNEHWLRRLRVLRLQFEREMKELRLLIRQNNDRRREIDALQNHLFSGTSIQESRKSVELSDITVNQGYNIKLLTIFNIVFLPLTFVTSIYGMENMTPESHYWQFGVTLAAVCVPFFLLVGFLNTDYGYQVWRDNTTKFMAWVRRENKEKKKKKDKGGEGGGKNDGEGGEVRVLVNRTLSTEEGMRVRLAPAAERKRDGRRGKDIGMGGDKDGELVEVRVGNEDEAKMSGGEEGSSKSREEREEVGEVVVTEVVRGDHEHVARPVQGFRK